MRFSLRKLVIYSSLYIAFRTHKQIYTFVTAKLSFLTNPVQNLTITEEKSHHIHIVLPEKQSLTCPPSHGEAKKCARRFYELVSEINSETNKCFDKNSHIFDSELSSTCLLQKYLHVFEQICPPLEKTPLYISKPADSFNLLYIYLTQKFNQNSDIINFIFSRAKKYENSFKFAASTLEKHNENFEKKSVLIYLSYLVSKAAYNRVAPTEKIMTADLIISIYLLGHDLIIARDINELQEYSGINFYKKDFAKSCPDPPQTYNFILTDFQGLRVIRKKSDQIPEKTKGFRNFHWRNLKCKIRTFVPFSLDPEFSHIKSLKTTPYSRQGLKAYQYLTPFPESDDNTFLGFAVHKTEGEPHKNRGLVLGFNRELLLGYDNAIETITNANISLHSSFDDLIDVDRIANHRAIRNSLDPDYENLLRKSKFVFGFGAPFDDYVPLEALAYGVTFIQQSYDQPVDNNEFEELKNRPNSVQYYSQNPYLESIGAPYVYTVDFKDDQMLKDLLDKVLTDHEENSGYTPYEFRTLNYLTRVRTILNADYCEENKDLDLLHDMEMHIAHRNKLTQQPISCSETCKIHDSYCEPRLFYLVNDDTNSALRAVCDSFEKGDDLLYPALQLNSKTCFLQDDEYLFSCTAKTSGDFAKFCPCVKI